MVRVSLMAAAALVTAAVLGTACAKADDPEGLALCLNFCIDGPVRVAGARPTRICHDHVLYDNWCSAQCHAAITIDSEGWRYLNINRADARADCESTADVTGPDSRSAAVPVAQNRQSLLLFSPRADTPIPISSQQVSVSSCADLAAAGFGFYSSASVCAGAGFNGVCPTGAVSYAEGAAACEAAGARLCRYSELNSDAATGVGCDLDDPALYCWVGDNSDACGGSYSYVSRCIGTSNNNRMCAATAFTASVKCCADTTAVIDSGGAVDEEPQDAGGLADNIRCMAGDSCGAACAEIDGCGWSSPRGRCMPGGVTSNKELEYGDGCVTPQARLSEDGDPMPLPRQDRKRRCRAHLCGAACATDRLCGWSTPRMKCVPGGRTKKREMTMGNCTGIDLTQFTGPDCARHTCGYTCAATSGCGWSMQHGLCKAGHRTVESEYMAGSCTAADIASMPEGTDTLMCRQYTCGTNCAAVEGCGWNSARQKCVTGASTAARQMLEGDCPGDNAVAEADQLAAQCASHRCAAECYAVTGCGWNTPRMRCIAGARTSQQELGMCTDDADWVEPTMPTDLPPTTSQTRRVRTTTQPAETEAEIAATTTAITTTAITCQDSPIGWTDNEGDGCEFYNTRDWCTAAGAAGLGWMSGDSFEQYRHMGRTAIQVCCACGGGELPTRPPTRPPTLPPTNPPTNPPTDPPTNPPTRPPTSPPTGPPVACFDDSIWWRDNEGDSCSSYASNDWCTADGGYGEAWGNSGDSFSDYAMYGMGAHEACCSCGGGSATLRPTSAGPTPSPTILVSTTPVMNDIGQSSVDGSVRTGYLCNPSSAYRTDSQLGGQGRTAEECINKCLNMDSCAYAFLVAPRNWCRTLSTCVRLESFSKFGTVWMKST